MTATLGQSNVDRRSAGGTEPPTVDVTVVIGVYNGMPYLIECLNSVLAQTIGRHRWEIVAVDDGSTDGSGDLLDQYARLYPQVRVVHQANSGTPAAPRNLGIELARGRYIFFLDNDDYLGVEALERLVTVADKHGSDVVVGRMVGLGRRVPTVMYSHNQINVDLYASKVYTSLRAQRLFSRAVIDRAGLRFPELMVAQDQPFAALAYIYANGISVVADYDCYYLRLRDDGENIVTKVRQIAERIGDSEHTMAVVAEHVEPGAKRDFLMRKHFHDLVEFCFQREFLDASAEVQDEVMRRTQALLARFYSPDVADHLPPSARLRYELVARGRRDQLIEVVAWDNVKHYPAELIESGRIFVCYPGFRDTDLALPDALFDTTSQARAHHHLAELSWTGSRLRIAGHAFVEHVDMPAADAGGAGTEVVLRERQDGREVRLPVVPRANDQLTKKYGEGRHDYRMAGFSVDLDLAGLAAAGHLVAGRWDVFLVLHAHGVEREVRFGRNRAAEAAAGATKHWVRSGDTAMTVTPYFTKPHGNLTLDVSTELAQQRPALTFGQVVWAAPRTLAVTGELDVSPLASIANVRLVLAFERRGGPTHEVAANLDRATGRFVAVAPLIRAASGRPLPRGTFTVAVILESPFGRWRWPVPAPVALGRTRWWRRGRLAFVTDVSDRTGRVTKGRPAPTLTLAVSTLTGRRVARWLVRRMHRT